MDTDNKNTITSAGLSIDPQLGELSNTKGESIRLTPINMKALLMLVSKAGEVVSRSEIFEEVWARQIVGDDTLTRCISDIRGQLRKISDGKDLIETLPKRGYRWLGDTNNNDSHSSGEELSQKGSSPQTYPQKDSQLEPAVDETEYPVASAVYAWRKIAISVVAYGLSLVLIASAIVGFYGMLATPQSVRIVVLPTESNEELDVLFVESINDELVQRLLKVEGVEVISRTALQLHADNPFPYFVQQFGAQWVVESRISSSSSGHKLSLSLVDARTTSVVSLKTVLFNESLETPRVILVEFVDDAEQFFHFE